MPDDVLSLATDASRGSPAAIDALYREHLPAFRAFVRLRMGPVLLARESATDVVQSVFRDVLEDLDGFEWRGEAAFKHWLYERGLRKVVDRARYWRAERRDAARDVSPRASAPDPTLDACYRSLAGPSQAALGREAIDRVERAFAELPGDYREVIVMARFCGLSSAETAERLGRTEAAARVLLCRALARLSTLLEEA